MDQKKIGGFLKELRKEKGVTQEQLAEQFSVSNRILCQQPVVFSLWIPKYRDKKSDSKGMDMSRLWNES